MNCDDIMEIYHKSLKTALSTDESKALKEHLGECEECRTALNWDRAIVSAIQSAETIVPQKDFVSEVCKKLFLPKSSYENNFIRKIVIYAAAVLAFAGIAVLWFEFWEYVQQDFLQISTYYSNFITDNLLSFIIEIPEIVLPQETPSLMPINLTLLFWIILSGGACFFIPALFPVLSYSYKK